MAGIARKKETRVKIYRALSTDVKDFLPAHNPTVWGTNTRSRSLCEPYLRESAKARTTSTDTDLDANRIRPLSDGVKEALNTANEASAHLQRSGYSIVLP